MNYVSLVSWRVLTLARTRAHIQQPQAEPSVGCKLQALPRTWRCYCVRQNNKNKTKQNTITYELTHSVFSPKAPRQSSLPTPLMIIHFHAGNGATVGTNGFQDLKFMTYNCRTQAIRVTGEVGIGYSIRKTSFT